MTKSMSGVSPRRWHRRSALAMALAGPLAAAAASAPGAVIRQAPQRRAIVDNDFAGDPDGLFALAHQWLSPSAKTVLVTSSALDTHLASLAGEAAGQTAAKGRDLARQLAALVGPLATCPVIAGAEQSGAGPAQVTDAARAIADEAQRDDPLPLVLTCGGPLTNVAAALRLAPPIARRLRIMWIGGALGEHGQPEYNFATDPAAALAVLSNPDLDLCVVPREVYRRLRVPTAFLGAELRGRSALGDWLYGRYLELPPFVQLGATITLGDSALIDAAVLQPTLSTRPVDVARLVPPRWRGQAGLQRRRVAVVQQIDAPMVLADLMAQLRLHAADRATR